MQISSSLSSVSGYSAMSAAFGAQDMDEMDAKVATDIMSARDTDGSGGLSVSELGTSAEKLAEYDTDGDGQVSQAELQAGLKAKREKMQAEMQNQMLQSGQMGMLQASMGGMDMTKMDAKMSQKIISEKDTNKDGVLSAEELGVSAANLSKVDSDGDGSVSEAELTASLKSHREEMMAENGGSMPPPPSGGVEGQGEPSLDTLISGLFSGSSSGSSGSTGSTSAASSDSESLSGSLADFLLRQKASSAYQHVDQLISSLFGETDQAAQSVSVSA